MDQKIVDKLDTMSLKKIVGGMHSLKRGMDLIIETKGTTATTKGQLDACQKILAILIRELTKHAKKS